jgi:hypothetical protein
MVLDEVEPGLSRIWWQRRRRSVNWADPSVPVGNGPSLPRWPVVVAAGAWLGWVAFLVVMAIYR